MFTYIIVEHRPSGFPKAALLINFVSLGQIDWLEDREWALKTVARVKKEYEASGQFVNRIFLSELVR